MTSSSIHQLFGSYYRDSQSLRNDRCQTILYKAVFEHFFDIKWIAALLLASKSFQNSSFGANFLVNFVVDQDSITLIDSLLTPSCCFSLQFVPSLHIRQASFFSEKISRCFTNFVGAIVSSKYLHSSLRSLTLYSATVDVLSFFFGSFSSNSSWPQLQDLTLECCRLNDSVFEIISKNALQLRSVNFSGNLDITDAGLESISRLSNINSLNLSFCNLITDAGMEHISNLANITSLDLAYCKLITDDGLECLAKLSRLADLDLCFCAKITVEAKRNLKTALPNCSIYG